MQASSAIHRQSQTALAAGLPGGRIFGRCERLILADANKPREGLSNVRVPIHTG
jgi:hypothetical protein